MSNEEKILEILTRMDTRLNSLEQGQSKLEQGMARLEQRQSKLEQGMARLEQRQSQMQEDLEIIKDDVAATKVTVGIIGDWAERMESTHNIGLYK